jgi:polyisoprenoid-binding protein YceI
MRFHATERAAVLCCAAAAILVGESALCAAAESQVFHIASRGARDANVCVESRAPWETIIGVTNKASGRIVFDPQTNTGSVEIMVDAASLETGIALRDEQLRGPQWLDAAAFPAISFRSRDARHLEGDRYLTRGDLTIRGVSREVETIVEAKVYPYSPETEAAGFGKGDAAHCRTRFDIKLSDFGIQIPPGVALRVSDSVSITVDVFAGSEPGPLTRAEEEERENASP